MGAWSQGAAVVLVLQTCFPLARGSCSHRAFRVLCVGFSSAHPWTCSGQQGYLERGTVSSCDPRALRHAAKRLTGLEVHQQHWKGVSYENCQYVFWSFAEQHIVTDTLSKGVYSVFDFHTVGLPGSRDCRMQDLGGGGGPTNISTGVVVRRCRYRVCVRRLRPPSAPSSSEFGRSMIPTAGISPDGALGRGTDEPVNTERELIARREKTEREREKEEGRSVHRTGHRSEVFSASSFKVWPRMVQAQADVGP